MPLNVVVTCLFFSVPSGAMSSGLESEVRLSLIDAFLN